MLNEADTAANTERTDECGPACEVPEEARKPSLTGLMSISLCYLRVTTGREPLRFGSFIHMTNFLVALLTEGDGTIHRANRDLGLKERWHLLLRIRFAER